MYLPLSKNSSRPFETLYQFEVIRVYCIVEIHFLLPKIPLLPRLADFGQLYFNKKYSGVNRLRRHKYQRLRPQAVQC